jgi:hypothetical protein
MLIVQGVMQERDFIGEYVWIINACWRREKYVWSVRKDIG